MTVKYFEAATVKWEKMSKSRGNVVSPDDVVHKCYFVEDGYQFFDTNHWFVHIDDVRRVSFHPPRGYMRIGTKEPVYLWPMDCIARFWTWVPKDNNPDREIVRMRIRSVFCGEGELVVHQVADE